jgi:hypothetical protein
MELPSIRIRRPSPSIASGDTVENGNGVQRGSIQRSGDWPWPAETTMSRINAPEFALGFMWDSPSCNRSLDQDLYLA